MKAMKGFKTIAFNVVMGAIVLVRILNPEAELPTDVDVEAAVSTLDAAIATVWSFGNMFLRAVTDSPIFRKE